MSRRSSRLVIATGAVLAIMITAWGVLQLLPADPATDPVTAPATAAAPATALEVTGEFLDAFSSGDAATAGALTDDPASAAAALSSYWETLEPASVVADRSALVAPAPDATTADERFTVTWDLGSGRTWSYGSTLRVVEDGEWRVHWDPALVHPKLTPGHGLAMRDPVGQPAVLDRDGAPLLAWAADGTTAAAPAAAPVLLPGMGRVAGQSAWHVTLIDATGKDVEVLHGNRAAPLASTVSRPVQQAAQSAVDGSQPPTVLVALQPSTGDLLAVAQNGAADTGPVALQGLFPPGSTFKIATAAALIDAGVADPATVLPCPGAARIGQRTVRNADFDLGEVPLSTAFAQSCNTTFAMQAAELPLDALPAAASRLGLDADFVIPGIDTVIGNVPAAANVVEQVENSIGQGRVEASCLGLALMSATVAAGRAVTPRLWPDRPTEVTKGYEAPSADVIASLRTMMRKVVTSGRATELAGSGAVHGKTGTAETADSAHGWFTGYRDDVAFAVLVQNGVSSSTAVAVTKAFLTGLG